MTESLTFENTTESPVVFVTKKPSKVRLQVIRDMEVISASRKQWNELAGEHPFVCWEWIFSWWQVYGNTREAAVLAVVDESGRWVGLFPLCIERQRFWGRVLVNMANGRACSDHVRPIIAAGYERQVLALMADWIQQQSVRGKFNLIDWDGVDLGDPIVEQLIAALEDAGLARRDLPIESSWVVKLPSDWTVFEKGIKKGFRRKLQKACRNELLPGVEIQTLKNGAELQENWSTLVKLHEARREALSQIGCFQETGFSEFLQRAVSRMAERAGSTVLLAKQDGIPFGMIMLLFGERQVYLYQSGFDPAQRQLEPGHLMLTVAVRHAIESGFTQFDFLRGDEPYKARWNAVRQPMVRVRLVSSRLVARCRLRIWELARAIKNRLRPMDSAAPQGPAEGENDE